MAMSTMTHYICTNCGFWQRHFEKPGWCPVCLDFRHTPPENGWEFLSADEAAQVARTSWVEDERGVVTFTCEPRFGIGPRGYLLRHPDGNVVFDHCGWYDDAALDFIEAQGGVKWMAASHPHAYGALWQLQECLPEAQVAIAVEDLPWTGAFDVTYPVNDILEMERGLILQKTGGHFDGHAILYCARQELLFAGDMLKLHFAGDGSLAALSSHKAFNRHVPMSHDELQQYASVLTLLSFNRVIHHVRSSFPEAQATALPIRQADEASARRSSRSR